MRHQLKHKSSAAGNVYSCSVVTDNPAFNVFLVNLSWWCQRPPAAAAVAAAMKRKTALGLITLGVGDIVFITASGLEENLTIVQKRLKKNTLTLLETLTTLQIKFCNHTSVYNYSP
jgi:hypothetical protein